RPEVLVSGEDVARKGGVYNVSDDLQRRFGAVRVLDTILDETSILGIAQGAAHIGLLPVPEIQYLAYVHNALDQIRGEAASLQFFSSGQFRSPMVLRLPGLAYQKGFGGHFHNDNSVGALRDIPGLVLARQAQRLLAEAHGIRSRVMDLRWLSPLPTDAIRSEAERAAAVLVVDECRATGGGVADAIIADLAEQGVGGHLASVRAVDS